MRNSASSFSVTAGRWMQASSMLVLVSLAAAGCIPIGTPCGGVSGVPCSIGQFCKFDEGVCGTGDETGACTAKPEVCTEIFAPVCGCNDTTYPNECSAWGAGVNVKAQGECPTQGVGEGELCGGIAGIACATGLFCKFETGTCGAADQAGECKTIPEVCTQVVDPICGCDDQTYDNECLAEQAEVSVQAEGECSTQGAGEGEPCGGIQGIACASGLFCKFELGTCGAADQAGECKAIPQVCTQVVDRVCGCDDQTYDNECLAERAETSVQAAGACP